MYNKIFKNFQVNVGVPFQLRHPVNFHTLQQLNTEGQLEKDSFTDSSDEDLREEVIKNAKEEAELIIKEAQYEALRLLENAEKEAHQNSIVIEEEARHKGYEDGYYEAKKQYEDLIQEAEYVREQARVEYKDVLDSIEADAINVILDIAKKVVSTELSLSKENVLYLVKQAFDKCTNKENVTLKVSPEDYDFIMENRNKLLTMVEGIGDMDIKKEPSLKIGACIVETPFGTVDASVQTKLKKIEDAFRNVIGK